MAKRLVVVESPNKVKKIKGILGGAYEVVASFGHVADLPASGDLAVDFRDGKVIPHYQALERAGRAINDLRRHASQVDEILLATDPDREGEAIAWHIARIIGERHHYRRVVFNAVTDKAVNAAIQAPRNLDQHLVDAQQARRVLDRVVGWVVSPTLRRGCGNPQAKSAGRVQSAALRLVCEREREIQAHATAVFYAIDAHLRIPQDADPERPPVILRLERWKGEDLGHRLDSPELAERTARWCERQEWVVSKREERRQRRRPPPPFTTATVQQAASLRLRYNPKQTMTILQQLFEQGHITYHRTDSTALDPEAIAAARAIISERFGADYLPAQAVIHHSSGSNTQEAHEAIRPTHPESGPEALAGRPQGDCYRLIWERFIACQMEDGSDDITSLEVAIGIDGWTMDDGSQVPIGVFRATVSSVHHPGWRKLGDDSTEERKARSGGKRGSNAADDGPQNRSLPPCAPGDVAHCLQCEAIERKTKAPSRFTQASLIKRLEKEGIGRPSTYATIMTTILERNYVAEKQRKLHATDLGLTVTDYLVRHFAGDFIDLAFTARLEGDLDAIARGERSWEEVVTAAAYGVRDTARRAGLWYDPLQGGPPPADLPDCPYPCPLCAGAMAARNGPYGPFYACLDRQCPGIVDPKGTPSRKTQAILDGTAQGSKAQAKSKSKPKAKPKAQRKKRGNSESP